jgi:hypothetical protein
MPEIVEANLREAGGGAKAFVFKKINNINGRANVLSEIIRTHFSRLHSPDAGATRSRARGLR